MKDIEFTRSSEYVLNKDKVINAYVRYMLNRTQSMFSYVGLPESIPQRCLELLLQTKGYCFVTKCNGELYALDGALGGELNAYYEPTEIVISNPALKLSASYKIDIDGVLVRNDALCIGLLPILQKYGVMLAENTISIRTVDIILRMAMLISAPDDKTYTSAKKFVADIEQGKISVIGESAFFDGLKTHTIANSQNYLKQFIEMEQYLKASCFNEIGLNANWNAKRESLQSSEVSLNDDFLLPLVDNMIKCRNEAIEKINAMYGTDISIDYASAWKVTHEENEKQIALSESITETLTDNEVTASDISVSESGENIHIGVDDSTAIIESANSEDDKTESKSSENTGSNEGIDAGNSESSTTESEEKENDRKEKEGKG